MMTMWAGYEAHTGEMRNAYTILARNMTGRGHLRESKKQIAVMM
jgi:hypothetical protein